MDQVSIENALAGLPLGPIRYLDRVGSTNDAALDWMEAGAPDLAVVIADEQTSGRGRSGRAWFTPPGAALAISFGLIPGRSETGLSLPRFTALGALAVADSLQTHFQQKTSIKWPNDVLIEGKKVAGVLAESRWAGNRLTALILGIGINIAPASVPPADRLGFPAVALETALGRPVPRLDVLKSVATQVVRWRRKIASQEFLAAWEARLAFRGQRVRVEAEDQQPVEGQLLGLNAEGALRLGLSDGREVTVRVGDLHLRPVDSASGSAGG